MALTKQNWKDILDKIYNNGNYYETYSGDNKNGLLLYTNSLSNVDVVYRREVSQNSIDTYIVGIFPKKNWTYTDSQTQEQGVYICKVINDDIISNKVSQIYASGASGWLNIKSYIRNILVFLGLKADKDFDEKNPALYQELVNICHKYFDTGKAPYYFGKYIRSGSDNYSTYVQHGVIKDIAIYLNSIGVFGGGGSTPMLPLPLPVTYNIEDGVLFTSYELQSKDEYIDYIPKAYVGIETIYDSVYEALNYFLLQFGNEIDFTNLLSFKFTYVSEIRVALELYEFPKDGLILARGIFDSYNHGYGFGYFQTFKYYYNTEEDVYVNKYEIEYFTSAASAESSHVKDVINITKKTEFTTTRDNFVNLKCNKYIKPFYFSVRGNKGFNTGSSYALPYEFIDSFNDYTSDTNIQYRGIDEENTYRSLPNVEEYKYIRRIFRLENIHFSNKDFVIYYHKSTSPNIIEMYIVRNVNTLKLPSVYGFGEIPETSSSSLLAISKQINPPTPFNSYRKPNDYNNNYELLSYSYVFDDNKTIDKYVLEIDTSTTPFNYTINSSSTTDNNITITESSAFRRKIRLLNFGEVITINNGNEFEGIEKITGATYPSNVIDESSFNNFVNSINGAFNPIRNPYYLDGELQDTTNIEFWLQCTTYKNPPATQAEAVTNDIEDMPDDEVKELEKTIDPDVDPNEDEDEDEVDKNKGDDDTGEMPSVADLPNGAGLIKIYKLTFSQLQTLYSSMMTHDNFHDTVSNLLNNPIEAIISLQAGFYYQSRGETTENVKLNGMEYTDIEAKRLNVTITNTILLGSNLVRGYEITDDYRDVNDVYLQLYLPFVGVVDLDYKIFHNKYMGVQCRIDNLTGSIAYSVFCQETQGQMSSDNENYSGRLIATYNGVCQQQIPLKTDAFMNLVNGLLGK